jgi:multidrug efflux pump subunit AcrA (membrane-fusion protein)
MKSKGLIIIGTSALAIALVFALPVTVPYSITASGRILSKREWTVALSANRGLVTSFVERASGVTKQYSVAQFDRGDAVEFSLDSRICAGGTVRAGDTVGTVRSIETERELARLQGELTSAIATLRVTVTGEKQSVVEEAEQQLAYAKRQAETQKAIFERQKLLYERGLIAQQEYEIAERRASISAIDVSIAEARLQSVTTGAKKEQADYVRARISSLQREIDVLERQHKGYKLVAPLSGVVILFAASDTLLVVADTTEYVVMMAVRLRERSALVPQQRVTLVANEVDYIPGAVLLAVDKTIHSLNGEQVVFATAVLEHRTDEPLHGLFARCSIECASVSPLDYLRRTFHTLVR